MLLQVYINNDICFSLSLSLYIYIYTYIRTMAKGWSSGKHGVPRLQDVIHAAQVADVNEPLVADKWAQLRCETVSPKA